MHKIPSFIFYFTLITISLSANIEIIDLQNIATEGDDFMLWSAIFGLGTVGLIALFLSSEQLKKVKEEAKREKEAQNKIIETQNELLTSMSEKIKNIAEEAVTTAKDIATNNQETNIDYNLKKAINSEKKLVTMTTNLIEFLRIKSKKIESATENLKLSNLLNDVSGTLKTNTKNIELELIYDIKKNIPENLKGDTLNLSKVLSNLLIFCVNNNAREIRVKISKSTIFNKEEKLYFSINSDVIMDLENGESIFNAEYNEATNDYDSLDLFIARELSTLMGGELIARNNKDGSLEFLFDIPYIEDKSSKEVSSILENKEIFIVDSSYNSAVVTKKLFIELKHKITLVSRDDYLASEPDFSKYDVAVIDEKLFTKKTVAALEKSSCKAISLSNLFKIPKEFPKSKIADIQLSKPLMKQQLLDTMSQFYLNKPKRSIEPTSFKADHKPLLVHRNAFENAPIISLEMFSNFSGTNILLVEDNLINQKVLISMLNKSEMNITVANNGEEALKILNKVKTFDIVFMDINMPIMDGYSTTTRMRTDYRFNQVPIIALTALTSKSEVDKMFNCGMNGYLSKPLRKEELFNVFSIFIDKRATTKTAENVEPKVKKEKSIVILDGLNVDVGISRANSNELFYKEILLEFRDAYGDSSKTFKTLVTDFRYEQLRIFCMDLNGLSGSIGAEDMHFLTTEILQRLLYKKLELIPTFVEPYSEEINKLNKAIDRYIAS